MPALDPSVDRDFIRIRLADPDTLLVACLCADWCRVCRKYRLPFNQLAQTYPSACLVWIDIETYGDWLDGYEVEDFPTLLLQRAGRTYFFGPVSPRAAILARMLADLNSLPAASSAPDLRCALCLDI